MRCAARLWCIASAADNIISSAAGSANSSAASVAASGEVVNAGGVMLGQVAAAAYAELPVAGVFQVGWLLETVGASGWEASLLNLPVSSALAQARPRLDRTLFDAQCYCLDAPSDDLIDVCATLPSCGTARRVDSPTDLFITFTIAGRSPCSTLSHRRALQGRRAGSDDGPRTRGGYAALALAQAARNAAAAAPIQRCSGDTACRDRLQTREAAAAAAGSSSPCIA